MMEGDSDMLSSIIIAFVQAIIRCPAVQKKAQQEIDSVGGENAWEDYQKLP